MNHSAREFIHVTSINGMPKRAKMPRPEPTAGVGPTHARPERKWKRTASLAR